MPILLSDIAAGCRQDYKCCKKANAMRRLFANGPGQYEAMRCQNAVIRWPLSPLAILDTD